MASSVTVSAVVVAVRNPDPEKVSAYECGFNAFDDARMKFDVRFYLVSILFIIFDLLLPGSKTASTVETMCFCKLLSCAQVI